MARLDACFVFNPIDAMLTTVFTFSSASVLVAVGTILIAASEFSGKNKK